MPCDWRPAVALRSKPPARTPVLAKPDRRSSPQRKATRTSNRFPRENFSCHGARASTRRHERTRADSGASGGLAARCRPLPQWPGSPEGVPSGLIDGAPRVGAEIVVHDDVIALRSARAGAGGDPRGDLPGDRAVVTAGAAVGEGGVGRWAVSRGAAEGKPSVLRRWSRRPWAPSWRRRARRRGRCSLVVPLSTAWCAACVDVIDGLRTTHGHAVGPAA
jgi:hypothetical protein